MNYRSQTALILFGALLLLLLAFAFAATISTITDINTRHETLQSELELLQADMDDLQQWADEWPGVTEIPDETIPSLVPIESIEVIG